MQNCDIRKYVKDVKASSMSRIFKRLRLHGLIERKKGTNKYFPTVLGTAVITVGLSIRSMVFIPQLDIN